jgi:hypothetical protein
VTTAWLIVEDAPADSGFVRGQRVDVERGQRIGPAVDYDLQSANRFIDVWFNWKKGTWWVQSNEPIVINCVERSDGPLRDGDELIVENTVTFSFHAPGLDVLGDVVQDGVWLLFSPMHDNWCYAQHAHDRTVATAFMLDSQLAFVAGIPGAPRLLSGTQRARVVADIAGVRMSDVHRVLSKRGDVLEASIVFAWLEAALSVACRGLLVSDAWITFDGRVLVVGTPENVDRAEWAAHLVARGLGALGGISPDELVVPSTELGLRMTSTIQGLGERADLIMQLLDSASQGAPLDAMVKNVAAFVDAHPLDRRFAQSLVAELFPREAAHDRAVREEIALRGIVEER